MECNISYKTVLAKSPKNSLNSSYKYKSSNIPFCFHQPRIACFPSPAFEQSSQRWRTQSRIDQRIGYWSQWLKMIVTSLRVVCSLKRPSLPSFWILLFLCKAYITRFSLGVTFVGPLAEFLHDCHLPLFHLSQCEHHFILPTDVKRRVAALYMNSGNLSKRLK